MTNTVVDPHAVVIHAQDTAFADTAVVRSRGLVVVALLAVSRCISLPLYLQNLRALACETNYARPRALIDMRSFFEYSHNLLLVIESRKLHLHFSISCISHVEIYNVISSLKHNA